MDARVQAAQNSGVARTTGDAGFIPLRGTRDGSAFVADWKQALIMEGRGFTITVGAFSTPVAGGGASAPISQIRPRFAVSVPTGTVILPHRVSIQCQTPLLATDADESECVVALDKSVAAAAGTSTAKTPVNLYTGHARTSGCSAYTVYTADLGTNPTLDVELARNVVTGDMNGTPANALWGNLVLLYEPLVVPIFVGPCTLLGYWGGTVATTGFAQVSWLELPSTAFA